MSKYTTTSVDQSLRPFEVVQVDDNKVAVHIGVVLDSGTYHEYKADEFSTSEKPQDLSSELIDARFLTVAAQDYICIKIPIPNAKAAVELLKMDLDTINDVKRSNFRVVVLAKITEILDEDVMDIEYRYKSDLVYQSAFFPPFTPIMWEPEKDESGGGGAEEGEPDPFPPPKSLKVIFTPGACHLSHLPHSPSNPRIFKINGESMLNFPIVDVTADTSWYISMPINIDWGWAGDADFGSTDPEMDKDVNGAPFFYVIGRNPCYNSNLDGECDERPSTYALKVMTFGSEDDGMVPEIYWRSDYIIHKNPRCHCCHCSDSSGSGSESDSGSGSDSGGSDPGPGSSKTAIISSVHSSTGNLGFMCVEGTESWFVDVYKVPITSSEEVVMLDPAFVDACEKDSLFVAGYGADKAAGVGIKIVDNFIVVNTGIMKRPDSVNVTVYGVRKGHTERLPEFTEAQRRINDQFYAEAHGEQIF